MQDGYTAFWFMTVMKSVTASVIHFTRSEIKT